MRRGDEELSRALVVYLGYRHAAYPKTDDVSLARELGAARAAELISQIAALRAEIGGIDIDWATHSLASGGDVARHEMQMRHPELSDEALDALTWELTFNWK